MELMEHELARLKHLRMKGITFFRAVQDQEIHLIVLGNQAMLSQDAIIVKCNGSNVGHVPDPLARVLAPMMDHGEIAHMDGTITGLPRSPPEGVWTRGGGIDIPCEYVLYCLKVYCQDIR